MSQVLYRKYRSQIFDELIGQEHISSILKNAVSQGQVAHAYLFHGPRGLGKTSTARILAKAVNCPQLQQDGNPCNKCNSCIAIQEGRFLDMIEIDAASNRGIDQIRDLKEKIEFSPTEGKYKVYIIDEVHMLTNEAFNALLKTLEEPPAHAIFILATTEIQKVPATILSRCQRFDFQLATDEELMSLIKNVTKSENVEIEDAAIALLVNNAKGSYRDVLSLLDVVISGQESSDNPKHISEDEVKIVLGIADSTMAYFFLEKVINCDSAEALKLISEISQKGVNLNQFIKLNLEILRSILLGELNNSVDFNEYSFAKKLDRKSTLQLINLFVSAERAVKDSIIPTLPLEMLVADSIDVFKNTDNLGVNKSSAGSSSGDDGDSGGPTKVRDTKNPDSKGSYDNKDLNKENVEKSEISVVDESSVVIKSRAKDLDITTELINEKWPLILKELKKYNSHLYAFFGRAKLLDVDGNILHCAVGFDFHKDRLECPKSKDILAKVFNDLFGHALTVTCEVDSAVRNNVKTADGIVVVDPEGEISTGSDLVSSSINGTDSVNVYDNVTEVFGEDIVGL
ncbi:DNA polymerase III subunit gamma/tau [Candidatus Dojkabacteria bacterium]|nr:DNA polymerase III subunit gamma/tau [Candidatus Dojkabacteria bacterium]